MSEQFDYGPTRVLSIMIAPNGMTHLMWWPRAREVTLSVHHDWLEEIHPLDSDPLIHRVPPHTTGTLTVSGEMQKITARSMEAAWAAAQERWREEDRAAAAIGPAMEGLPSVGVDEDQDEQHGGEDVEQGDDPGSPSCAHPGDSTKASPGR